MVQTYNPGYYAVRYAAQHDYNGFYSGEISYRREFGYPPFNRMARLVFSHSDEGKCFAQAERMAAMIGREKAARGLSGIKIIGPAPALVAKLRGRYQVQVILLGRDLHALLQGMDLPAGWVLDVDPVGML
ncbi:MAG: hypothetical protein NT177_02525 [Chloroflexi bacterium]|nr:hypothetical protein [Chloroflexota bacterium]